MSHDTPVIYLLFALAFAVGCAVVGYRRQDGLFRLGIVTSAVSLANTGALPLEDVVTLSAAPVPLPPGSSEALEQGCLCPELANAHGAGYMGGTKAENGETIFVIDDACPLHKEFLE